MNTRLTERDLDASYTGWADTQTEPLETVEQAQPWLWLAYAAAVVAGAAASALLPIWSVTP